MHDVFNRDYCVMLSVDKIDEDEGLSVHEYLTDLKGKMGVYGLWIEHTECYDHDMHRMLCLYAGKGFALGRIKSHITEKWPE
ncbi:hypothetical protein KUC_1460 [Vreelandella boliviensis LC1]|uniref:Uncharacterized protein n=1 Tax=Vreelandella boliviensis LC1 TaxID=1072583 RepID=A0A7U9C3G9_9GAMM|nr:hypothetical protein KUC_1460 [Halomonas boliviensis LC1]